MSTRILLHVGEYLLSATLTWTILFTQFHLTDITESQKNSYAFRASIVCIISDSRHEPEKESDLDKLYASIPLGQLHQARNTTTDCWNCDGDGTRYARSSDFFSSKETPWRAPRFLFPVRQFIVSLPREQTLRSFGRLRKLLLSLSFSLSV